MCKIKYRECDFCGRILKLDRNINGYCIFNRLFHKIDICNECFKKIKRLELDKEIEEKTFEKIIGNNKYEHNIDMKAAYYEGIEDAMEILAHRRLIKENNIKVR